MSHKVWGDFLTHDRLEVTKLQEQQVEQLIALIAELHKRHPEPHPFRSYKHRQACREQVCVAALDLGIDLTAFRDRVGKRKMIMGRGLLDVWNKAYAARYGSNVGTAGIVEVKRRGVSTRLSQQRLEDNQR